MQSLRICHWAPLQLGNSRSAVSSVSTLSFTACRFPPKQHCLRSLRRLFESGWSRKKIDSTLSGGMLSSVPCCLSYLTRSITDSLNYPAGKCRTNEMKKRSITKQVNIEQDAKTKAVLPAGAWLWKWIGRIWCYCALPDSGIHRPSGLGISHAPQSTARGKCKVVIAWSGQRIRDISGRKLLLPCPFS